MVDLGVWTPAMLAMGALLGLYSAASGETLAARLLGLTFAVACTVAALWAV